MPKENTKCPCGAEAEVLRPTMELDKRQLCRDCFEKEKGWGQYYKPIEQKVHCTKDIHCFEEKNGEYCDCGKKQRKFVEQEVPTVIRKFREKFLNEDVFDSRSLFAKKYQDGYVGKMIEDLEQFIQEALSARNREIREWANGNNHPDVAGIRWIILEDLIKFLQ